MEHWRAHAAAFGRNVQLRLPQVQARAKRRSLVTAGIAIASMASGSTLLVIGAPWLSAVAVVSLAVVGLGCRHYANVHERYTNLQRLYDFNAMLASAVPGEDLVRQILEQSASLVRAERAELVVPSGTGWRRYVLDARATLRCEVLTEPDPLVALVFASGRALLIGPETSEPFTSAFSSRGHRHAVVAGFGGDEGWAGALLAGNRADPRRFDVEDLALLQALASHASVALRNAELVERLTEEAAHRAHQALHDALTGLGNRELFFERVKAALGAPSRGYVVAVMLMDLDEFKEVNDTLGHHTGDTVLREIASRLSRAVGLRGTVARLGGDEFAVCIPGCRSIEEAATLAHAIRRSVETPLDVGELVLEVHASVGVAVFPEHGADPSSLLQRADVAMYSAKGARSGVELYAARKDHYSQRRLTLSGELRQAIAAGEVEIHYQPKLSMVDGCVSGVEALARWRHPRHGFVPPDEFIPVAEQSGLIQPLTRSVLSQTLHQLARWRHAGLDLSVAVNLSARSLMDMNLADDVARAMKFAEVPASAVVLELTESTVMADPDRSQSVLQQLADLGCKLAIDDFGTGYSSLSRLKQLPVSEVKIDKSFVLHMATDDEDAAIVRSIVDLARNLGLLVVAEGVEDHDTAERLRRLGCDALQGYFICEPRPAHLLDPWLESQLLHRLPRLMDKTPSRRELPELHAR